MKNLYKVIIALAVLLVAGVIIGFVFGPGFSQKEKMLDDYLKLDIWDKEVEALKMLDGISTLETDDDRMTVLNEVNKNFREIKAYIENLAFTEPEIQLMNKKQLEVFRIYNEAITRINKSGNPDWEAFKKETDLMRVLLDEFFLMATTIK
ncbi:MAG: hypothetical protein JW969_14290 [Spirochaetales bacterium]|nr:hypothetical protein [Spirochaetales bacterium]